MEKGEYIMEEAKLTGEKWISRREPECGCELGALWRRSLTFDTALN